MNPPRVVLVGYDAESHIGRHLAEAARTLRIEHRIVSPAAAFEAPRVIAKFNWLFRGHRPTRLHEFSERVIARCRDLGATHLIATGIAPVEADALEQIRAEGVRCVNWLTDDPWNPAHHAPWFLAALSHYDIVYSPRHAVFDDLARAGVRAALLPFAYCPSCHFPIETGHRDVISFVGGADADRVPYIAALIEAGVPVEVYGGYWEKQRETKAAARGFVDTAGYRGVVASSAASICLVRTANRDEHVMRSYEVPAMRGFMLAQDTPDHRVMFGAEGESVLYFSDPASLVAAARVALASPDRSRMAGAAHARIAVPANTYASRLQALLG